MGGDVYYLRGRSQERILCAMRREDVVCGVKGVEERDVSETCGHWVAKQRGRLGQD